MLSILVLKNSLKFSANTETDLVGGIADSCFLQSIPFAMLKTVLQSYLCSLIICL